MTLVWMEAKINEEVRKEMEAFSSASFKSVWIDEVDKEILLKEAIFLFFPEEVDSKEVESDGFDYPQLSHHIVMRYEKKIVDKEKTVLEVLTILKERVTSETSLEELKHILGDIGFKETDNDKPEMSEAATYHLLAIISLMMKKKEEARECFNKALRLYQRNVDKETSDNLIRFYHNLALFYKLDNKIDEYMAYLEIESIFLGAKKNKTEEEEKHIFQIELEIAKYYLQKGLLPKLDDMLCSSLFFGKKIMSDEELIEIYEIFLEFYHEKANHLHKQGEFEDALDYYLNERKLIDILPFSDEERMRRLSHWSSMIAELFFEKGDYEKAEYYYLDSIKLREKLVVIARDEYGLLLEFSYECLMRFYKKIDEKEKYEKIRIKYEAFKGGNK